MTPSGWDSDTRYRDAGHDEMQIRVYRDWVGGIAEKYEITREERKYVAYSVQAEIPLVIEKNKLLGFADIGVRFQAEDGRGWWQFYELKPRIGSIGGVMRQCEATDFLLRRIGCKNYEVIALVYADDPKAILLEELFPRTVLLKRKDAS